MREIPNLKWQCKAAALVCLLLPLMFSSACSKGIDAEKSAEARDAGKQPEGKEESFFERISTPRTREIVVPEGTKLTIRLTTPVSSQTSRVGDAVTGLIAEDVVVGETKVIPAGSTVRGSVTTALALPKIGGRASLAFSFTRLETPEGKDYPIEAMFARTGPSETAKDATTIVAGAIVGAVAGHQVDDDQGRAIGGLAGAGIGTAIAASTDGQNVVLPESSTIRLTLRLPVNVEVRV